MALLVEDGSIVAGAESYISVADADTYFTAHGSPATWTGATTAAKESALRYGTRYLDTASWKGEVTDNDQPLDWPRAGVYDDEDRSVSSTSIPVALKEATCEAALEHLLSPVNTGKDRGGKVKRTKLGPLEKEFMDHAPGERTRNYVWDLVAPYLAFSQAGLRLVRA